MRCKARKTLVGMGVLVIGLSGCQIQVVKELDRQPKEERNLQKAIKPIGETVVTKTLEQSNQTKITTFLEEQCKQVFANYYELLTFNVTNYVEEERDGQIEARFWYQILYKNYDKDPDTVGYIQDAKSRGDEHYQEFYNEYLAIKEMNFELKAVIDQVDMVTLYTDIDPTDQEEWEQVEMQNFILSD